MNASENKHLVQAKGILSAHNGINVYRGCTHGCIYCDSRSLCYHTPVPFEDVEAKENARIEVTLKPKGRKAQIKNHAEERGETLNSFINRAIDETIERDNKEPPEKE